MKKLRIALIVIGALLILDTLTVMMLSNFNLGVILPAFFGVPLVLIGILYPHMHTGILCVLKWLAVAGYAIAVAIFAVCGTLMIRAAHAGDGAQPADALIVLGAAVHGDRVTWVLSNRLDAAAEYLTLHPETTCIVSGGQGDGETVTEASAMKRYLVERKGIDESRILTEEASTSTIENFRFSKAIIDGTLGADATVAFVTTGFHVYRAGRVARAEGVAAYGVPAGDVWYLALNNFMRESVGICVYALRGNF